MDKTLAEIATRHQSHFERLKAGDVKKFDEFLIQMDKDIREILTRDNVENTRQLKAQLKLIDAALTGTMNDYAEVWHQSIQDAALYEADFEKRTLDHVVDGVSFDLPSDNQIIAAVYAKPLGEVGGKFSGKLLKEIIKTFTKDEVAAIQAAVRLGYAEGQTTAQILENIRGTKKAKYNDGKLAVLKRNQESVVRTALQHASNTARNAVWDKNRDVIRGVKWLSTLDKKTSPTCRSLDGQVFPIDKGQRPPAHIRCRSTTIAVLKKEFAFLSKNGTRVMRNPETGKIGKVDADLTYYGWLKRQPADVQDSIIGKTRGKLLRDGGLSAERFAELQIGKLNEPLSLEQMRKLDPVAFKKAGI